MWGSSFPDAGSLDDVITSLSSSHDAPLAIVVGASGCVGCGVTQALVRSGYLVVAPIRDPSRRSHKVALLRACGVLLVACDVMLDADAAALTSLLAPYLHRLQLVVAAVGSMLPRPLISLSASDVASALTSNLVPHIAVWRCLGGALLPRGEVAGGGSTFVFVTGKAGEHGSKGMTAVTDAGVFAVAACARHEAGEGRAVRVVEARLYFGVEDDDAAAGEVSLSWPPPGSGKPARPTLGSKAFGALFPLFARAKHGDVFKLLTPDVFAEVQRELEGV